MNGLDVRPLDARHVRALTCPDPTPAAHLTSEHRATLAARFRATRGVRRRRLEAWDVERPGVRTPFRWTPVRARRAIGRSGLARYHARRATSITAGVADEIDELFVRAAAGFASPGSLADWISRQVPPVVAGAGAAAISWATSTHLALDPVEVPWRVCDSDAFYDVAAARTSLHGRRDVIVCGDAGRTLVRVRAGRPGPTAGSGLRADLVIDALCDRDGVVAQRIIGLWPESGLALAVDGTLENARAGARSLVRVVTRELAVSQPLAA